MTPEERQLLAGLFDRIHAASNAPRDRDAEAYIGDAIRAIPSAPYLLSQTVLVLEEGLRAANERVQQLETQMRDLQAGQSQPAATSFLGGIGKSMFGGSAPPPAPQGSVPPSGPWGRAASPPPMPAAAPPAWGAQQQPNQWQQPMAPQASAGGGFLKGALGAAAGVAGGMLLADSIRGMMGGHNSPFGVGNGYGHDAAGVTNNYYGGAPGADGQPSQAQLADMDRKQDALQDANDDSGASYASDDSGGYSGDDSTDV